MFHFHWIYYYSSHSIKNSFKFCFWSKVQSRTFFSPIEKSASYMSWFFIAELWIYGQWVLGEKKKITHIPIDRYGYRYILLHIDMIDSTTDNAKTSKSNRIQHIAHTIFYGRIILLRFFFFNTKNSNKKKLERKRNIYDFNMHSQNEPTHLFISRKSKNKIKYARTFVEFNVRISCNSFLCLLVFNAHGKFGCTSRRTKSRRASEQSWS